MATAGPPPGCICGSSTPASSATGWPSSSRTVLTAGITAPFRSTMSSVSSSYSMTSSSNFLEPQ